LTFVAIDEQGHPRAVPKLDTETPFEKRRFREASRRRAERLRDRERLQAPSAHPRKRHA
jgi:acyl-CoA hydrolase